MKLVKDLSKEDFSGLAIGDGFETRGIFFGVSEEPLVWTLREVSYSREYFFKVTYFGILVGEYCISNGVATELA